MQKNGNGATANGNSVHYAALLETPLVEKEPVLKGDKVERRISFRGRYKHPSFIKGITPNDLRVLNYTFLPDEKTELLDTMEEVDEEDEEEDADITDDNLSVLTDTEAEPPDKLVS